MLFELGLGKQVVGVTKFDHYPEAVERIARVGGFLDLNTELVVSLKPDLIVLLKEQASLTQRFEQLGLSTLVIEHRRINGILESLSAVGERCGVVDVGSNARKRLEAEITNFRRRLADTNRPLVAVVAGRDIGAGSIRSAFLSGNDGFYSDLVELAGGKVAYQGATVSLPGVSLEGLIALKPDIILDVVPGFELQGFSLNDLEHDWADARKNIALKNTRIVFLSDDFAQIPGPRFDLLLDVIARAIHPEKFSG